MSNPQQAAIADYLKQLAELTRQRSEIERKIQRIEKAVRAMIEVVDGEDNQMALLAELDDIVRPVGLTNAIRAALQTMGKEGLTPMEARDMVRGHLLGHSNALASVHTVLKRLARTDDVEVFEQDGKTAYRWVSGPERMARLITEQVGRLGKPKGATDRTASDPAPSPIPSYLRALKANKK